MALRKLKWSVLTLLLLGILPMVQGWADSPRLAIEKLAANLEKLKDRNRKSPRPYQMLGQLYSFAWATGSSSWASEPERRMGGPGENLQIPHFDPNASHLPQTSGPKNQKALLEKAAREFEKALELNSNSPPAQLGLAWVQNELGNGEKARKLYRQLIEESYPSEAKMKSGVGAHWSFAAEAIDRLSLLLDPKRDAAELAELKNKGRVLDAIPYSTLP